MSIELYWDDDEQTVMLCEFNGRWTWDELHAMLLKVKRVSQERQQVFGAILDVRNGMQIPGGNLLSRQTLDNFQKLMRLGSDGKGPVVVLGMSGMVKSVFDAIRRVDAKSMQDVYFASDEDEARDKIYAAMALLEQRASA